MASLLHTYGCAATYLDQVFFDLENDLSFAPWCPVELGCRAPRTSNEVGVHAGHCPAQCDAWRSNYLETLAGRPCVDSTAAEFASGPAAEFLVFYIDTFVHVFWNWTGAELRSDGCANVRTEVCGFPYYLRAVCPVTCGCGSHDSPFLCPGSCTSSNAGASEFHSALNLGSTSPTTIFLGDSSTTTIENKPTTLSENVVMTSPGNDSFTRLEHSAMHNRSTSSTSSSNISLARGRNSSAAGE